ncbi:twin-arginine translocation signal domain-containing protein [Streptomyces sp. NPDC004134]|uniref:twin-arginine translocation signal domain-containing protein n=1 Tax=Streptomyces sp. NPDC004134 TaxID=3364691 RepID=UPI003691D9B0
MSGRMSSISLPPHVLERADVRAALRCHDFGKEFKLARQWGGISFVKIADACDIKPERVGRLARGEGAITTYEKITRIADALAIPGHLVGLAARPWEQTQPDALPQGEHTCRLPTPEARAAGVSARAVGATAGRAGGDVERRRFLAASGVAGIAGVLPERNAGSHLGRREVAQLRMRSSRLRRLDDVLGGADTRHIYRTELDGTVSLMRHASYSEKTGKQLLTIVSELAQQAGWAAFDAGDQCEASILYRRAHQAASEAGDRALEGNSLAFLAYQQVSGASSGVATAVAACRTAGSDAPPTVRGLLHERRAWAHARAGEAKESEAALAQAEEALSSSADEPGPEWASWVDGRELRIMKGRCWTELHRPLRAVPELEAALADFDDAQARDKALYLSWLAHAYLDAGEVEQSAQVIGRAIDLSEGIGSVRPRQRIQTFLTRLHPHRSLEPVAEVLRRGA